MKQVTPFVISEFTNPSGKIVFQLYARLDSQRFRKNFPTRTEAEAERQVQEVSWLQRDTGTLAAVRLAQNFWPWSLLTQPAPLPETLISSAPAAVMDDALGGWGSPASAFRTEVREAYIQALSDPARVHAICEEYRAAVSIDVEHDLADRRAGRQIEWPVLVLWSKKGPLNHWYQTEGGPLALWRKWSPNALGQSIDAGHFFPEEMPELTANLLGEFFATA